MEHTILPMVRPTHGSNWGCRGACNSPFTPAHCPLTPLPPSGKFFKAQNVLAVDWDDWDDAKYRYVEVGLPGMFGRQSTCSELRRLPGRRAAASACAASGLHLSLALSL